MSRVIIAGGRIIDPASKLDATGDIVAEDGRIVQVGGRVAASVSRKSSAGGNTLIFHAEGCIVCPGLIDPHVHLREPGGEDAETIESGSAAAIEGGFTTICCMPNTRPAIDDRPVIEFIRHESARSARCRIFPIAAITRGRLGEELSEIRLLAAAGAVGFSDDGDAVESPAMMVKAFRQIRLTNLTLMQHCQDRSLTRNAVMNAGPTALRLGLIGWPAVAEELTIERDIRLNRSIGCRYHVQHISAAGSVEIVRRAQAEGQPVSAEASPHHLLLTEEACDGYNTRAKMNPPLRQMADVEAVRQGVADGTITILATDHAPHTAERKALPFDLAPFGIVGLETALALNIKALIDTQIVDWPRLVRLMTLNPARLCNLDETAIGLGALMAGGPADVTIIDPEVSWMIDENCLAGKSRNTPFLGWPVRGRAVGVFVNGQLRLDRQDRTTQS